MDDNEIIKSLECCSKPYCNDNKCPLHKNTVNTKDCITQLSTNALDLINRQKAEIERMKKENHILSLNADTAFQDGLNEIQDLYAEQIKSEIRAEAVKEFAERLKQSAFDCDVSFGYGKEHYTEAVAVIEIDNLVKEFTEGKADE